MGLGADMSDFMDGVNKWAIDNPLGAKVLEQQSRIEQLERYLRLEQNNNVKISREIERINTELSAERALADRLERELSDAKDTATAQYKGNLYPESADGWEMCVNDMLGCIEDGRATHRKARVL